MLGSTVAAFQDNSAHGEDSYLVRDLGNDSFLDAVMDGVTGHGGEEASQSVVEALESGPLTGPEDVINVLNDLNEEFYQVGGGRFLLTTFSGALYLDGRLHIMGAGDSPVFLVGPDSVEQLTGRVGGFLHVGVAKAIGAAQRPPHQRGASPGAAGPPLPARRPHRDLPLLRLIAVVDGPVAHASVRIRKPDTCSGFRKLLQFNRANVPAPAQRRNLSIGEN